MISLLCKRAQLLLARVLREESGSAAVNVVFFLIGGIALTAFVVDATRVSADGARLKQATDAAAQAVAMEAAKDSETDVLGMAQRYVAVNLGLDKEQLSRDLSVAVEPVTWNDYEGYRVSASFRALPSLLGGPGKTVEVASAAVAIYNPLEIAFVAPSTINETQRDMQAIRDIGEAFYDEVIDGRADRWMAGWGAMALSPGFRGIDGWGDLDHPRDFSEDGKSTVKAIVMLANLNGSLIDIDMDANNFYLDLESLGGSADTGDRDFVRQRIEDLCDSFKSHQDFYFYMLIVPPSTNESGLRRYNELKPTLLACGRNSGDVSEVETPSFAEGKETVIDGLKRIASDLESKSSFARLIE